MLDGAHSLFEAVYRRTQRDIWEGVPLYNGERKVTVFEIVSGTLDLWDCVLAGTGGQAGTLRDIWLNWNSNHAMQDLI